MQVERVSVPSPIRVSKRLEGRRGLSALVPFLAYDHRTFYLACAAHALSRARDCLLSAETAFRAGDDGDAQRAQWLASASSWLVDAERSRQLARSPGR